MDTLQELITQAGCIYQKNFPLTARFERAIFFSWGCAIGDCTFCYMSTQPKDKPLRETKRSNASILAEVLLAKKLGWEIGFFTGGIGVLRPDELEFLLKSIYTITGEKIWFSLGPVPKALLRRYFPYIRGVVGSVETINPGLHATVCPSKPLRPYEQMFQDAKELGLQRAMTFIVGLGETRDDFTLLKEFITKYGITKIHVYGLIPQKGTPYENASIPSADEQAWWIAQLRIHFPTLDIQCGVWEDRAERVSYLLQAGANSFSKFKAIKLFGTSVAKQMEEEVARAGRRFEGTLTVLPDVAWEQEIAQLPFEDSLKKEIKEKLDSYVESMRKNVESLTMEAL